MPQTAPGYFKGSARKPASPLVIVLLAGGDKRTRDTDIGRAIEIAKSWKE
jgi:putative component of toxin-antitoxin plasmid stabilization module